MLAMESEVIRLARTWDDFMTDHMVERFGAVRTEVVDAAADGKRAAHGIAAWLEKRNG